MWSDLFQTRAFLRQRNVKGLLSNIVLFLRESLWGEKMKSDRKQESDTHSWGLFQMRKVSVSKRKLKRYWEGAKVEWVWEVGRLYVATKCADLREFAQFHAKKRLSSTSLLLKLAEICVQRANVASSTYHHQEDEWAATSWRHKHCTSQATHVRIQWWKKSEFGNVNDKDLIRWWSA